MSRRIVRLALATALTVGRVGAAELVETVERTLSVGEAPRISITHVSGIVRLGSHGAPQMIVKAVTRAREGDSHAAQAALRQTTVAIEGAVWQATMRFCFAGQSDWEQLKRAASEGRLNAATADYEVLVPRRAAVELSTVAGEALVAGIEGGLIVNAVSSSMLLERITGGCRVTATSGNVTISGAAGGLAVQTVGGNVDARGLLGACIVDTVGGKINLILDPGNLQSARITTVVGPVDLQLPERPGAAFNLETTGGTIGGDYPLPPGSPHRRLSPARTPGPTITVRTSSGTITVRRLPR